MDAHWPVTDPKYEWNNNQMFTIPLWVTFALQGKTFDWEDQPSNQQQEGV